MIVVILEQNLKQTTRGNRSAGRNLYLKARQFPPRLPPFLPHRARYSYWAKATWIVTVAYTETVPV